MLYVTELGHNATEETKNICCTKGEGAVDYSTAIRRFKKFHLGKNNFGQNQVGLKP